MFQDSIKIKGIFEQKIYKLDSFGKLNLVEEYTDNNLVVTLGKEKMTKLLANDGVNNYISSISVGTDNTTPTVVNTTITDPFTTSIDGYSYPSNTSVKFDWTIALVDANGKAIGEYGLICQDSTLFARKTRGTVQKESDVLIEGSWTILFI